MLIACDFGRVGDRICPPSPRRLYSGDMTGAGADGGSPTIRPFDVRESDLGAQFTAFIDENRQHLLGSLADLSEEEARRSPVAAASTTGFRTIPRTHSSSTPRTRSPASQLTTGLPWSGRIPRSRGWISTPCSPAIGLGRCRSAGCSSMSCGSSPNTAGTRISSASRSSPSGRDAAAGPGSRAREGPPRRVGVVRDGGAASAI